MTNIFLIISFFTGSLAGFFTNASANSCPNHEACFELKNSTTGNCHPTVWLNGLGKIGDNFLPFTIGDKSITTVLRGFDKYWLTSSVSIIPGKIFQEGQNQISLSWDSGCSLADSSASIVLNYYAVGKSTPKQICLNATKSGRNTIQCNHQSVDLKALDEALYHQIETLKAGIKNFDYSADLHTKNSQRYKLEIPTLEKILTDLNESLNRLNLDDFLSIKTEDLATFIKEDSKIKEKFEGLKKTVGALELEVNTELAKNQREIQQTMAALIESFGQTNQEALQYNFNFTPQFVEINLAEVDSDNSELVVDPAYTEIANASIESFQRAIDLGKGTEFLSEFSTWEKQQTKILSVLTISGANVIDLKRFQLEQQKVIDFVKQHVDTYGFFADSKVDIGRRRIVATKVKDIDGKAGQDLADELNQWKTDINESQKRLLDDLNLFEPVLDQLKQAQVGSRDPQKTQALAFAEIAVKDGLESLVDAARNARDPSSVEEFKEDISEAEVAMKAARQLLDFCVGLTPIGTVNDFISAGTGVNVVTGETLDEMGQTIAFVGGVIGIVPGGALVKGPIKALGRIVGKFSQFVVSAGKRLTGVSLARVIGFTERIVDSAMSLGLKLSSEVRDFADTLKRIVNNSRGGGEIHKPLIELFESLGGLGKEGLKIVSGIPGLKYTRQGTWVSQAGLIYGKGSKDVNRLRHILKHTKPNPNKLKHTVFGVDLKDVPTLIDEAWIKKSLPLVDDPGAYIIEMGRTIGTQGEKAIKIIVKPGTFELITAYPF